MSDSHMRSVVQRLSSRLLAVRGRRQFLTDSLTLGSGTLAGHVLVVASIPFISRLYSAEDIGRFGLIVAFLGPAVIASALRFDFAIASGVGDRERDSLLLLSLCLLVPMSLLSGALLAALAATHTLGFGILPVWSAAPTSCLLLLTGAFTSLRFWHVARSDFPKISRALVAQGLARATAPILLAPVFGGWWGLALSETLGRGFGLRQLLLTARRPLSRAVEDGAVRRLPALASRFIRFPVALLPSALLDGFAGAAPTVLVGRYFSVGLLGQFVLAQRIVSMPGALIGAVLSDVYNARFIDCARRNPAGVQKMVIRGALRLLFVSIAICLPIAMLSILGLPLVLGRKWHEASLLVACLAPAAATNIVSCPLSRAMLASRVPQLKLIADGARLVLPSCAIIFSAGAGNSIREALLGYSALAVVGDLVYCTVIWVSVAPSRLMCLSESEESVCRPKEDEAARQATQTSGAELQRPASVR